MNSLSDILKSTKTLPLEKEVVLNLICTNNYISEKMALFFKAHDLTGPQYNVLRILRGQDKPANLSAIQERMVHKNSNAGRLIDKLVVKKYVKRSVCENNRRKIEVIITNKGLEKLNEIDPALQELEKQQVTKLTKNEKVILNTLLEKLRT